jgi:hypothetical protein
MNERYQGKLTVRVSFAPRMISSIASTSTYANVDVESAEVVSRTVTVSFDKLISVSSGFRIARSIQNASGGVH